MCVCAYIYVCVCIQQCIDIWIEAASRTRRISNKNKWKNKTSTTHIKSTHGFQNLPWLEFFDFI